MTNTDLLKDLQAQISEAQRREAQAQVAREAAETQRKAAAMALKEEFGVTSPEEALKLAASEDEALAEDIRRISELLGASDG